VAILAVLGQTREEVQGGYGRREETQANGSRIRKVFGSSVRMNVDIPTVIDAYNHFKGGVDRADQYREYFFTQQINRRNWPPLFYWLLDIALINAYRLRGTTAL
jgi:hypothetical protein